MEYKMCMACGVRTRRPGRAAKYCSTCPNSREKRKSSRCRECSEEFYGKKGQRFCDPCRGQYPQDTASMVRRSTYRLSYSEEARLMAITACEVCGAEGDMVIDHSHETGKIRGRLCRQCNFALGHSKDDVNILRGLANYLEDRNGS